MVVVFVMVVLAVIYLGHLSDVYTRVPVSHACMTYVYAIHVAIMFTRAYIAYMCAI